MGPFQLSLSELANTISKQLFQPEKPLKRRLRSEKTRGGLSEAQFSPSGLSFEERIMCFCVRSERRIENGSFCQVPQRAEAI